MGGPAGKLDTKSAHQHTAETAMGDDQNVVPGQGGPETVQAAIDELLDGLNARVVEGPNLAIVLLVLIHPEGPLSKARVRLHFEAKPVGDRLRGLANAHQIARLNRDGFHGRQDGGCDLGLRQSGRIQWHVGMALTDPLAIMLCLTVAKEIEMAAIRLECIFPSPDTQTFPPVRYHRYALFNVDEKLTGGHAIIRAIRLDLSKPLLQTAQIVLSAFAVGGC